MVVKISSKRAGLTDYTEMIIVPESTRAAIRKLSNEQFSVKQLSTGKEVINEEQKWPLVSVMKLLPYLYYVLGKESIKV